jgi:hypothetical protein
MMADPQMAPTRPITVLTSLASVLPLDDFGGASGAYEEID